MQNLKDKVAVITGASTGIGKNIAIKLAEAGSNAVEQIGISPVAIADAVLFAVGQPDDIEVGDIVIRPSKQN